MTSAEIITKASTEFDSNIAHLKTEFARLQVGRANPILVEGIPVEMYGVHQPLKAVASISITDPRTIVIQPWDRSALGAIEKAIVGAGIGLNPVNDGVLVRISIPPLTEERRRDLTKRVKSLAEEGHIGIRTARHEGLNALKALESNEDITKDDLHSFEKNLQDKVDAANAKIDELAAGKEQDVMTV